MFCLSASCNETVRLLGEAFFLCLFFGSVSEIVFKYSILREIKLLLGQPLFYIVGLRLFIYSPLE